MKYCKWKFVLPTSFVAATQHSVRIRKTVTELDIMVFESYDGRQNTDATSNNLGLCGDFNRTSSIPAKDKGNTNIRQLSNTNCIRLLLVIFVELDLHLNPLHSTRKVMKDRLSDLELQMSQQAHTIDLLIKMVRQPEASEDPNKTTTLNRETTRQLEEQKNLIAHQRT